MKPIGNETIEWRVFRRLSTQVKHLWIVAHGKIDNLAFGNGYSP